MTNARGTFINYLINIGRSMQQAISESDGFSVPTMEFMEVRVIEFKGQAVIVFRGGPDSDPWWDFGYL